MNRKMLGLRDVLFIAPTPSSLHGQQTQLLSSDHHPSLPLPSSAALGVSVGIFPLLAAAPCLPQPPPPPQPTEHLKKTQNFNFSKGDPSSGAGGTNASDDPAKGDGESSMTVCRDCGNRAKKECEYRRCRTCCKGRGNYCSTHVRSTWVPASRRRERQMLVVMDGGDDGSSGSSSGGGKKPKVTVPSQTAAAAAAASHASTSNATTPRSFETNSSTHQDASFKKSLPGQVRAPAVFRCHRVTAINSGEGELAYQATVNIGGHVFKGFLYDQGLDLKNPFPPSSSSQLHLETGIHLKN